MIRLDEDYRIKTDDYSYILQYNKHTEAGKVAGKEIKESWKWVSLTYHHKFNGAVQSYVDAKFKDLVSSDEEIPISEIVKKLDELKKSVEEKTKGIDFTQ